MRVAAIDCGTNALRLLISEVVPDGPPGDAPAPTRAGGPLAPVLRDVARRTEIVRLGQDVDGTGRIAAEAMERAMAVFADYARLCDEHAVDRLRIVATSASRDAANARDFLSQVRRCFPGRDVRPEVIDGREEAELSFRGATAAVAAAGLPGEYLVVDLGGGSTEFVRGGARVRQSVSLDIGSVRLTERYLRHDPPTPAEGMALRADVQVALDRMERQIGLAGVQTLVGLAGSVATVAAHALDLAGSLPRSAEDVHLARHSCADTRAAALHLAALDRPSRAALPYLHPGRVDIIAAGAIVWAAVVERVQLGAGLTETVTCLHDLLDGIALGLAARS